MNHSSVPAPARCSPLSLISAADCEIAALPLLDYVQQHWAHLLTQRRLAIVVAESETSRPMAGELFVGDEFRRSGKWYLDIVLRLEGASLVPTVLIFDKTSHLLIESEINDLPLSARIVSAGAVVNAVD